MLPRLYLADGLQTALVPGASGIGLSGNNVFALLLWTAIGIAIAVHRFEWEPQAARG